MFILTDQYTRYYFYTHILLKFGLFFPQSNRDSICRHIRQLTPRLCNSDYRTYAERLPNGGSCSLRRKKTRIKTC